MAFAMCIMLAFSPCFDVAARAETWTYPGAEIMAEGAIVMDADTGTVLWERNAEQSYYPASITKILTALLVLENCALTDEVDVTSSAVHGLEAGATTAGLSVGDRLSVEDLLYAMLLRSANDAANALAIHVSGSVSEFAALMNERAKELGCLNSNFKNPSGLTDSEHQTSAYDMALIMKACLNNEAFLDIESHSSYKIGATEKYPGGLTVTMGHQMIKSGTDYHDDRVIAGKTGFITASGNTLVTAARENGRTVIAVVLSDKTPYHYTDTSALINFGLDNFENVELADKFDSHDMTERLISDKIITGKGDNITIMEPALATLPLNADINGLGISYDYSLPEDAPDMAVARMNFEYEGRAVGTAYVINEKESDVGIDGIEQEPAEANAGSAGKPSVALILAAVAAAVLLLFILLGIRSARQEKLRRERFLKRRQQRLREMGMTEDDFLSKYYNDAGMLTDTNAGIRNVNRPGTDMKSGNASVNAASAGAKTAGTKNDRSMATGADVNLSGIDRTGGAAGPGSVENAGRSYRGRRRNT